MYSRAFQRETVEQERKSSITFQPPFQCKSIDIRDIQFDFSNSFPEKFLPTYIKHGSIIQMYKIWTTTFLSFKFSQYQEGCMVRTSTHGGYCQIEECAGGMPFTPGLSFVLDFTVEEARIQVKRNKKKIHFVDRSIYIFISLFSTCSAL